MSQTLQRFAEQERQLHEQMRMQILSSLSPVSRRAVAAEIGQLAIAPSPDPQAVAKRLDAELSAGERQRILNAQSTFQSQSRQLHEQMRTEIQNDMPAGAHAPFMGGHPGMEARQAPRQLDAGTALLLALSPHPLMGMGFHAMGPAMMMHMDGAPPPQP
ncbi:MAG: hypothetical protein WA814_08540 [Candidatus Baltobacteraceae bacterium]